MSVCPSIRPAVCLYAEISSVRFSLDICSRSRTNSTVITMLVSLHDIATRPSVITHSDRSRGGGVRLNLPPFVCLSVCFSAWYLKIWYLKIWYLKNRRSWDYQTWRIKIFNDEFWKTIYFGVKRSEVTKTLPAWVFALLWVLASFGLVLDQMVVELTLERAQCKFWQWLVFGRTANINKNSSGDEIANVNLLTTISHTRRPTSKYRKRDKPTSFNKLDDR